MKKHLLILLLILFSIVVFSCSCGQKVQKSTWQEQYDLGVRYLSNGNYQDAILAFTAAIEIDPKRPEAYLSLAETYIAIDEPGLAREILERGASETSDDSIRERLEILKK